MLSFNSEAFILWRYLEILPQICAHQVVYLSNAVTTSSSFKVGVMRVVGLEPYVFTPDHAISPCYAYICRYIPSQTIQFSSSR